MASCGEVAWSANAAPALRAAHAITRVFTKERFARRRFEGATGRPTGSAPASPSLEEAKMTNQPNDRNPRGDKPGKASPNEPASVPKDKRQVSDPHPDTEEGYDRDSKVPTTGL